MLRNFTVLIVIFIFSFRLIAQDYINDYHPRIYKAEDLLISHRNKEALEVYSKVLKDYERVFSKDLYNAILCGAQAKANSELLYGWVKRLYMFDISETVIHQQVIDKLDNKPLQLKLMQDLPLFKAEKMKIANQSLKEELHAFFKRDQYFRMKKGGYTALYRDSIKNADKENMSELIKLVKKNGFPTEEQAGIEKPGESPSFYIVLHHYYQTVSIPENGVKDKDKVVWIVEQAVREGKMSPLFGVRYINYSSIEAKKISTMQYKQMTSQESKNKIDAYRKNMGLLPVEETLRREALLRSWRDHSYIFG